MDKDNFELIPIYDNWTWNDEDKTWEPPIPYPTDGNDYYWNIELESWQLIVR